MPTSHPIIVLNVASSLGYTALDIIVSECKQPLSSEFTILRVVGHHEY